MNYRKVTNAKLINLSLFFRDLCLPCRILKRNQALKERYKGERCFILGSGKSIDLYDLPKLKNEIVITQNNFHKHKDIATLNPEIHCVVPFYQTEIEHGAWIEWLSEMKSLLPEDTLCFFSRNTHSLAVKVFGNTDNIYYIDSKYRVLTLGSAKMDITKSIMEVPTALTQCLIIAIYLGFSEIILLGFDFDQIISNEKNNYNRFYGLSKITDTEAEKRNNAAFADQDHLRVWYNRWRSIKQLTLIKEFANDKGTKIVNGSEEGILEVFGREPVGKDFTNITLSSN